MVQNTQSKKKKKSLGIISLQNFSFLLLPLPFFPFIGFFKKKSNLVLKKMTQI